jgi:hypothetical protein
MNVTPEHERDLMSMPDERKWKLIKSDVCWITVLVVIIDGIDWS